MTNYEKGLKKLGINYADLRTDPAFAWRALEVVSVNYGIYCSWFVGPERAVSLTQGNNAWVGHGPDIRAALYAAIEQIGLAGFEDES